jgi:hypothetical protein
LKISSFVSKPKGVSLRFYKKNRVFTIKIGRKSVFHPREAPILTRLDITVLYIVVWGFWKILSFGQKPKEVSFWFYKKCMFATKTGRKSVFHLHEAHIFARLDIMVLYTIFLRFWKISSFASKPKGSFWFYRKTSVHDENGSKIHISSLWGPYSFFVRHFGDVHKFLGVLKNIECRLKTERC